MVAILKSKTECEKEEVSGKKMRQPCLLSLDPATHCTGYAVHEGNVEKDGIVFKLVKYGLVLSDKQDDSLQPIEKLRFRCQSIVTKIGNWIGGNCPTNMAIEFPEYQPNRKDDIPTSRQVEAVRQLSFLCGKIDSIWDMYIAGIYKHHKINVPPPTFLTPSRWKGQLPKDVSANRCHATYGVRSVDNKDHNFVDAIMIGDYFLKAMGHKIAELHEPIRIDL